jgi:hypothetical protein
MNTMPQTKEIIPTSINVKNGTSLRNKLFNRTLSITILATTYNQTRKL